MKASCVSMIFGLAALQFGQTDSAGRSVILELPKLPVIRGSDVTLQCKSSDGSKPTMFFFRNGSFIGHRSTGEFTIGDVQQTDEGLYHCSAGLFSLSEKTWLRVT
ncbi:CXADR-like membrane protein, partial [Plectropomus leopardus]|uniref:CXADR-like membrane protein n=1 Tax=Plectropomus leopardus TaxID=160734 RepID=UPI001C4D559E